MYLESNHHAYSNDSAVNSMMCPNFKKQKSSEERNGSAQKKNRTLDDERAQAEQRRKEKLEQNRISAMKSRLRKKLAAEELKKVHDSLLAEHKALKEKHDMLLRCLAEVESKPLSVQSTPFEDKLGLPGGISSTPPLLPGAVDPAILQAALINQNLTVPPYAGVVPPLTSSALPLGGLLGQTADRNFRVNIEGSKSPFDRSKIP